VENPNVAKNAGWFYYATWSVEGDSAWVVERIIGGRSHVVTQEVGQ
jgi:hypothetical protein